MKEAAAAVQLVAAAAAVCITVGCARARWIAAGGIIVKSYAEKVNW